MSNEEFEESEKQVGDEVDWFDQNRESLIAGHHEEFALIAGHKILGYFTDDDSASRFAKKNHLKDGTYDIHQCLTAQEESERFFCSWMIQR
jgi:hypothetical protein